MLFIFFIHSFSIAGLNHSRLMAGKVVENPQKEQDEEDLAILSSDSESEIFDADDLDYVPQVKSGVVGVNPALLDEEDCVMTLKTCLMSPLKRKLRPSPIQ